MSNLLDIFFETVHTVPQMVYNSQANFGGRPANLYKEEGKWRMITYNDLVFGVENIAIGLMRLGLKAGDLVGIKAHTSARWTWADLGSQFAGLATVSIYPSLSRAETVTIGNHSELKLLFVDNKETLYQVMGYMSEIPSLEFLVCMEKGFRGDGKKVWGLGELMHYGSEARTSMLPEMKARQERLTGDSPSTMIYTSGTTGALKGVMLTHSDVLAAPYRGYKHLYNYGLGQDFNQVAICYLPLSHILEKINSYYGPLCLGALIGFSTPATLTQDISVIRPTWVMFVPRVLSRLFLGFQNAFCSTEQGKKTWEWAMDVAVRATYALEDEHGHIDATRPFSEQLTGSLREEWIKAYNTVYWRIHHALGGRVWDLNVGGAYLDPDLHRKFIGMGFNVGYGYGLTETAAGIAEGCPNANKVGWVSPPNPTVELKLDEDGEILLRGPGIIRNYYKNPEADKESFTPDGFLRTGDIGEIDEDGWIRVVDRKKTLIVLDTGKNVAPGRIESMCDQSPLLDQVAVLGQDRKFIAALIVPNLDILLNVFRSQGIPFDESKVRYGIVNGMNMCIEVPEEMVQNELVKKAIQDEIDKVNKNLEDYETIKAFRILNRRFTEESGEVTPSSKLKMKVILEKYKDLIEDIYS